jgi:apolipoprotein N-acyltransferase
MVSIPSFRRPAGRMLAGIALSGVLSAIYVHGGHAWVLGFVMLVPWLRALDTRPTLLGALLSACLMSVAFTAAAFWWFGMAIGDYTRIGGPIGLVVLLLLAPFFQPQFLAFSLVRHLAGKRHGPAVRALAAAAAWVGTEWALPKVLGDTLGYGLYPSAVMRQFADLGGSAGLTVLLLLANEGFALAWARRAEGGRSAGKPLVLAALVPGVIAAYGFLALALHPAPAGDALRVGLVQSNLVGYEERKREAGANAVVREVLDTHFAMTYDAVERQQADAVLWSETVYPTTFGNPKSEAGAEFDAAIQTIVNAARVPFVFGTYDRDARGEYNAAAFVLPQTGLLGFYRKTRLFPLTEYVPQWLDGPALRRWLPWTGSWLAGDGARVFPLRLTDGREVPVMTAICLDDVDTTLAIEGARMGARAMLTLSNDSWFTRYPQGAQLHHAVAAFRSIETRLPQYRVTSNGTSAVIDATGTVVAASNMGERTLVVGQLPVPQPPRTLMVMWGDWVGPLGVGFLVFLALLAASPRWLTRHASGEAPVPTPLHTPTQASVLPGAARLLAGLLRGFARLSLLGMGAAMLLDDSLRGNTLAQMRLFVGFFLLPEAVAGCVLLAYSARLSLDQGMLVLQRGKQRRDIASKDIAAMTLWQLPMPGTGLTLHLTPAQAPTYHLATADPLALAGALEAAGAPSMRAEAPSRAARYAQAVASVRRGRLDSPWVKFLLFPLLLALPAFHLHQNIAYGGWFGEFYTFGLKAYGLTFALWWASWTMGVVLCAAALRAVVEAATLLTLAVHPPQTAAVRATLERMALAVLYLGLPGWLLLHASW